MASKVTIVHKGKVYQVIGNPLAHTSATSNVLKSVCFFGSTTYKVKEIKDGSIRFEHVGFAYAGGKDKKHHQNQLREHW